jgi:hypothetical protein
MEKYISDYSLCPAIDFGPQSVNIVDSHLLY